MQYRHACIIAVLITVLGLIARHANAADQIRPLQVDGENFVDPDGKPVRFWGVNTVALYPEHGTADALAENLAALQVNLVRPHHMLRPSSDWVVNAAPIVALQKYEPSTRQPDPEAWDRFDYFNAALRKRGIYVMLSVWWTRKYQPGDVDVLQTDPADRQQWSDAIAELNSMPWKQAFDPRKMLCLFDERVAALEEEFARQLLTHVNPYTKLPYGQEPQVLTLELQNETSSEYIIICGNKFPEYFQKKLEARWQAFAAAAGIEAGDLYKPADAKTRDVRGKFLRKLDEDYLVKMGALAEGLGCKAPVTFSNLWEGEHAQQMYAQNAGYIEDHMYADPMVAGGREDIILKLNKTPIAGKPFIVGELNQAENPKVHAQQSPVRTMLPLAVSAYGSLHNWSGITFFAWIHGDKVLGADGWAVSEGRESAIGNMISDGMQIDHLRTCGILFRRGLLQRSTAPITLHVDDPVIVGDYHGLVRGKYSIKPGWQNIHAVRKAYGPVPAAQASAAWMTQKPANPLVADTKQIVKDVDRKQLTVAAPQAEAFSGWFDGKPPAALKHLELAGDGFATVVMVADDGKDLADSGRLIVSRTNLSQAGSEIDGPVVRLKGMTPSGKQWHVKVTRPRDLAGQAGSQPLEVNDDGTVQLPDGKWHECELELR